MGEFLSFIIDAYKPPLGDPDPVGWRRQLRLLEAGEPVTVQVWELPDDAHYPARLTPDDYVTVHGDGTITEAT